MGAELEFTAELKIIDGLKNDESIERNVDRAREFLLGNGRFVGRDHP